MRVHAFEDSLAHGRKLARGLGCGLARVRVHHFPDGESLSRIRPPAGRHAIVVRSLHDPNAKWLEVLLAADALRRDGAERVTLVTPYLPYMRQDAVFHPGEPISQRVFCDVLGRHFEDVLTMEAHLHRVPRLSPLFRGRARSLSAAPVIARWLRAQDVEPLLVGPDSESEAWVRAAAALAGCPWTVGEKKRLGDRRVRIRFPALPENRRAVIIDDIASSGVTLAEAARGIRARGVDEVEAVIVHAIFAGDALERIYRSGIRRVVTCDCVAHESNAISTAPLFVEAIREGMSD